MRFGICLPYMERDYDRATILAWCRRADAGPFYSLSCGERITGYTFEMRVLLAAAAAVTERVRIVPSLYVLPMHSAVWAAKEIATLDVLSEGRVTMTVGVGGREKDYRAVGASFERRHQRMDQQVDEMRRIWAGEPPFEGADPVGPEPIQHGGPPLLLGAMGPKSMQRGARWAQGTYAFSMNGEGSEIRHMLEMADKAWEAEGRADRPYRMAGFWCSLADNAAPRLRQYVFDYLKIMGDDAAHAVSSMMTRSSVAAIRESIDSYSQLGVDEIMFVPATADLAEIDRLADLLARL
ncbi:MAG: LLM class flavin-dependent oxidoreductase [Gammaproteobacteria bacterium]|nr:LLM class flavin-dependent oxidoreductase [Gammaproteobacteria bacterium]MBP6051539.1 LLM class flavin-dependent oxidoreductase [Pseudomonadales bacterium]MBK6582610.1 LLM class flavin-dependent oxidoreductase [Gammaproteobacteria bacterium]MBK7167883.1 LLM class flavin-dependent oxidoreductase [Gammaproteobacteria bacterium]MBK7518742.1 LLM class flavin-dependent oxidoreductase [Gammaproteobacteria bacterium]